MHIKRVHSDMKPSKVEVKKHIFNKHSKTNPFKKHACKECEASFESEERLDCHMNIVHLNMKPYKCKQCGLSFPGNRNLVIHIVCAPLITAL